MEHGTSFVVNIQLNGHMYAKNFDLDKITWLMACLFLICIMQ